VKDGSKAHVRHPVVGAEEAQHVLISADTQAAIDAAVALIEPLLRPAETSEQPKAATVISTAHGSAREGGREVQPAEEQFQETIPALRGVMSADAGGNTAAVEQPTNAGTSWQMPSADAQAAAHSFGVPSATADPAAKLFVGQLPQEIAPATLEALFGHYGAVAECDVIRDKETGLGRGFAFLTMGSVAEAHAAVHALNGYLVAGKRLQVAFKVCITPACSRPVWWSMWRVMHFHCW
jgi:hypothetical protein